MYDIQENVSLRPYNTFGIAVVARNWLEIEDEQTAIELIRDQAGSPEPVRILGGGSNILLTEDVDGLIVKNSISGLEVVEEDELHVILRIGGGENWHKCVLYCLEQNWGGIENLSLIPGCAGAAPIQNIGAYGVELQDVFEKLEAVHLPTAQAYTFSKAECRFGYRDSIFKREAKGMYLITRIYLRLRKKAHLINTTYGSIQTDLLKEGISAPTIQDVSRIVCSIRRSKLPDPEKIGNSGSFFKNPVVKTTLFEQILSQYPQMPYYPSPNGEVKIPAGWLIEMCGWKGKRLGNYGVHDKQALVLVNYGGASGADIFRLSKQIQKSVYNTFRIELEREVNVW